MNFRTFRFSMTLILVLLLGCKNKEYLSNISDQKIVSVLIDVHLANALIDKQTGVEKDSLKEFYTSQILQLHSMSRPSFDSIINYVHLDINRYRTISAAVEDSLSSIKSNIEKENRKNYDR